MKQDIDAALARLAEAFPQTFVLEKYRPHWPLKVGIAADIPARCPAVERRVLSVALSAYARRVMYLRGLVAGAARVDLDGNPAGEVTARDAEYAAAKLAETLASREAKRAAAVETKGAERIAKTGGGNDGRGISSRKGLDAERKGPCCACQRSVNSAGEFPAASGRRTLRSLTGLNPGDAGIRGCLNTRDSITKFYWRFRPAGVPGFSLSGCPGRGSRA